MKITIISGSHRKEAESQRVGRFIEKNLATIGGTSTYFFSLSENPLPLWDEGVWEGAEKWRKVWAPISQQLQESDGFVVISPEWSGMVPAGLKNFFLLCGQNELAHKPGLIVAVSSGIGGSYPVSELRESSYKNTRLCYIPDHVIIRTVGEMLKGDTPANKHDADTRKRLDYSLRVLLEYAKNLKGVRESGIIDYKSYPYGM
jgi:NAD(P)H-dependent FMN reductase